MKFLLVSYCDHFLKYSSEKQYIYRFHFWNPYICCKDCSIKFCSKHSSNTVLCLLQNLMEQMLYTLFCISLGRCSFGLETRIIIKNSKIPVILWKFSLGCTIFFFFENKNTKWPTQKTEIFNSPNPQYFFAKII